MIINIFYILILFCQLHIFAAQKLNELCTTKDNEPGACKLFSTCSSLNKFEYSADNICDNSVNEVVCCKLLPEPVSECGTVETGSKIINGIETPIYKHPWIVPLYFKGKNESMRVECAGTIINARYVLTAAHCVHESLLNEKKLEIIKLGVWDLTATRECSENDGICADHMSVRIEQTIIHENFNPTSIHRENDIALLRLDKDIQYSNFIRPICLPPKVIINKTVYQRATAIGWGRTENGTMSNKKMQVDLYINKLAKCARKYSVNKVNITEYQICASGNNKDSCDGDSGGPLVAVDNYSIPNESYYYLTGVVSYGPPICGSGTLPSVYTNILMYMPWIKSKLRP